jgi:hypothetical protein
LKIKNDTRVVFDFQLILFPAEKIRAVAGGAVAGRVIIS